jgi:hypothetical protein
MARLYQQGGRKEVVLVVFRVPFSEGGTFFGERGVNLFAAWRKAAPQGLKPQVSAER